ncbi:unnamed protein product [Heterobilharzia americana]|nr:unnamed protein product [Heterobilharzia americana]
MFNPEVQRALDGTSKGTDDRDRRTISFIVNYLITLIFFCILSTDRIFILMAKIGKGVQIPLSWIPQNGGKCPKNAISVDDGVYIGRCKYGSEFIPGKFTSANGKCYCSYGGNEFEFVECELLCDTSIDNNTKGYEWVKSSGGEYPKNAIVAGIAADGKPLIIARGCVEGYMCVGKVHDGHKFAYMPWGGIENSVADYEVLVWKKK